MKKGSLALVVAAGALVLSTSLGIRQTFGLFIGPIAADHLVGIGFLSFAIALQNLVWGLAQPFAGALTDRFGPAPVVAGGAVLYGAGLLAVVHRPDALAVVLGFGVLVGVGQSAMTFAVVISSVSRAADAARRATAVAFAAAGGSLGQVALVPVAQIAISHSGFRAGLTILAFVIVAVAPLGLLLRQRAQAAPAASVPVATSAAIRTALRDPSFLFLTAGFFACGFQLAFMGVHLPTYLGMCHIGANVGAAALATIGFFNIIGSFGFGRAADRVQPQVLLTILYAVRATATAAFLAIPISAVTTLVFAVVMGLTWLGTVPLTNAVIARLHGLPNLGALFGLCFVGHQIGSFFGALAGGLALQYMDSYTPVWISIVVVGYAAALLNVPIRYRTPLVPAA
ncbi:MAG: major facilitator superfamily 1 [Candidatus Eremiobacteraeota bacterium]|nr:major facilitator superfamily 1 [Candidatus Eremiobacteraeota bacterium]